MITEELLRSILRLDEEEWADYIPAEHVSRHYWQLASERIIDSIRHHLDHADFELSQPEISIHYHRRLRFLADLIKTKLT